jgi:ABC-type Na+ transport system ATPase subunit NatA
VNARWAAQLDPHARPRNKIVSTARVLEVVEKVATTVLILRKGEVVAHDSVATAGVDVGVVTRGIFAQSRRRRTPTKSRGRFWTL